MKHPIYQESTESDSEEEVPLPPKEITIKDIKITSFSISPDFNEQIYEVLNFEPDSLGVWCAKIQHYKTDRLALRASFDVVAAKVTVKDVIQVSDSTVNDFSEPVIYRLYAGDGQYRDYKIELKTTSTTGLPIVALFTDDGKAVESRDEWLSGRMVIDPQDSNHDFFDGRIEIKGRGNNSWKSDKKPYAIKLSEKSKIMGMKKHKRWVLLANSSDRTLMRNRVAFEIGRRTGLAWTPDNRYVEVILNGKYLGNYLMCEQIRVDKNRVNIVEMSTADNQDDALTGGYLLEFDRYYDEINKFRTKYCDLPVNIKEPDEDILTVQQKQYITDYINNVEELLYGKDQIDPSYAQFLDIDSFIDWWIVMELTHNRDGRLPGSCYMYKDRGGKLCAGPLWDFDLTTFIKSTNFLFKDYEITDFTRKDRSLWYKVLFQDPVFQTRAKVRWQSYKAAFEDIVNFIDEEARNLEQSAAVNWSIWTLGKGSNQDEELDWKEAVDRLRANYIQRLQWMDGQIARW